MRASPQPSPIDRAAGGRSRRLRPWGFYALLAALVAVFFRAVVFRGEVFFFRDFGLFFYPKRLIVAEAVRNLRIPFWESLSGGGVPVLGAYQSAVFYPFALIYYVLPMPYSFMLFVVLHFLITGAGAFLLLRACGARAFGAAVGALLWTFAPAFVSIVDNVSFITALSWMPWCLAFGKKAFDRPSCASFAGVALSFAMALLAGAPEPVMFIGAAMLIFLCCRIARAIARKDVAACLRAVATVVAGLAVAFLIAGVELMPFFEHLKYSERAAKLAPKDAGVWAMAPGDVWLWMFPRFHLYPKRGGIYWPAQGWLKSVYLGASVPVLAAWTVLAVRRRRNIPFAVMGLLFALLSFGGNSPVWRALYEALPGFGLIRYPVKFFLPVAFAISVLAGFAVDDLVTLGRTRRSAARLIFFVLGVAGVLCIVAAAGLSLWPDYARAHVLPPKPVDADSQTEAQVLSQFNASVWSVARTGLALVVSALAISFAGLRLGGRRLSVGIAALGCFMVADLFVLGLDLNPTTHKSIYTAPPAHLASISTGPGAGRVLETESLSGLLTNVRIGEFGSAQGLMTYLTSIRGAEHAQPEAVLAWAGNIAGRPFPAIESLDRYLRDNSNLLMTEHGQYEAYKEGFYTSCNLLYGVPVANPGEVLKVKWDAELFAKLVAGGSEGQVRIEKLYSVSTIVDWTKNEFEMSYVRPAGALPRATLVTELVPCDTDAKVLETISSPEFDPATRIAVTAPGSDTSAVINRVPPPDAGGARPAAGTVSWLADDGNRQVLAVDCLSPAYLYVADNFYPSIRATVDGADAPVLRANYAFRAVAVPAGRHKVEFRFRPQAFHAGLFATCAGIAVLLAGCAILRRGQTA